MRKGFRLGRVLALCFAALLFAGLSILPLLAKTDFAGGKIPLPYFAVPDSGGANNGPGQKDLTQMGWIEDVTTPGGPYIDLFWSWDEITIGGGNTLDGCALFDNNGNTLIDYAVCGSATGKGGGMVLKSITVWTCVDSRNDRCGSPTVKPFTAADVIGGGLKANPLSNPPVATDDLLTNTDPFSAGAGFPYDTTLRLRIRRGYLPSTAKLTNVCSYPSTQPNSDPSDCNNPPGSGFLQISKDAHQAAEPYTNFSFNVTSYPSTVGGENNCPASAACNVSATQVTTATLSLLVGTASIEEVLPQGWSLVKSTCGADSGSATNPITLTIDSGVIAQCAFENSRDSGTIKITKLVNDSGTFTLKIKSGATTIAQQTNVGNNGFLAQTSVPTGTYAISEEGYGSSNLADYTSVYSCAINNVINAKSGSGISLSVDVGKNDVVDCTFTNTRVSGYLQIVKNVVNTADPAQKQPKDFQYVINGGSPVAFPLSGIATVAVDPNGIYTVTEPATAGYAAVLTGDCTSVTVASGQTKTCTITNTAQKAKPTGSTTQNWVLHDKLTITGIKGTATTARVNFRLYSDAGCATLKGQELNATISGGVASTTVGIPVTTAAAYYWRAEYTGDVYNDGFTTACGSEVTTISAVQ